MGATIKWVARGLCGMALVGLGGCGARARGGDGDCRDGQHWADPDGAGGRCIDDTSACDRPSDCPVLDDACCVNVCAAVGASSTYGCQSRCDAPECQEGSCGAGQRCHVTDACRATCVPDDLQCPAGWVPADPTGTNGWVCARGDSECLRPADCAASPDPCCSAACADAGDAHYACATNCPMPAAGIACMCTTDADCEAMNGPGWTCASDSCFGGCFCLEPVADPCACEIGAYVPVCGVDGQTYDAACGEACVPVEIACRGECPCP